jgi:hypothetical protein
MSATTVEGAASMIGRYRGEALDHCFTHFTPDPALSFDLLNRDDGISAIMSIVRQYENNEKPERPA